MCDTCGCTMTPTATAQQVTVLTSLLAANDHLAHHNRHHFEEHGVLVINLMSSPGSGKTALLEQTIRLLKDRARVAVIEGDLETDFDAQRIRAQGVPAWQITTGSACHLDARMIHDLLHDIELATLDILFIENVGNLVCPAAYDLGQHRNVVLLSVTEGDDKPSKYPVMFRAADLMIVSKTDLLPYLGEFSVERAEHALRSLAATAPVLSLSPKTGAGVAEWVAWLLTELTALKEKNHGQHHGHHHHD